MFQLYVTIKKLKKNYIKYLKEIKPTITHAKDTRVTTKYEEVKLQIKIIAHKSYFSRKTKNQKFSTINGF